MRKQKTVRLSTIIRKARDKYLWDGTYPFKKSPQQFYSCWAIDSVNRKYYKSNVSLKWKIYDTINNYGCDTTAGYLFDNFKTDELKQGARFLWLSFMIEATKNVKIKL
jgi:hypothetical protein